MHHDVRSLTVEDDPYWPEWLGMHQFPDFVGYHRIEFCFVRSVGNLPLPRIENQGFSALPRNGHAAGLPWRNPIFKSAQAGYKTKMKIEGIKGCYEKTGGLFYFARMCSKIRLHAQGKLPKEHQQFLGTGFDGRTCRYLCVSYEDVKAHVLSGKSDQETLEWCLVHGRRLTDEQILIYNSFMSKRGWRDDETDGFIPEMIKKYGLKNDGSVLTDFDLIEMDEGRWYPDMWRDAWK